MSQVVMRTTKRTNSSEIQVPTSKKLSLGLVNQYWGSLISKCIGGKYEFKPVNMKKDEIQIKDTDLLRTAKELNGESKSLLLTFIRNSNSDHKVQIHIEDCYINGKAVAKDSDNKINNGDEISIGFNSFKSESLSHPSFIVQIKDPKQVQKNSLSDSLDENLTCPICFNIFHHPVSVLPCFHSFCGTCIAQCYSESKNCPLCRQSIKIAQPNRILSQISESFLNENPEKKLGIDELTSRNSKSSEVAEFIKECVQSKEAPEFVFDVTENMPILTILFKRNRPEIKSIENCIYESPSSRVIQLPLPSKGGQRTVPLKVDLQSYITFMDYLNNGHHILHPYSCSYCLPTSSDSDRHLCTANDLHSFCTLCGGSYPRALSTNNGCSFCDAGYCPSCSTTLGGFGIDLTFQKCRDFRPEAFPDNWFWNNITENTIFSSYLSGENISPSQLYEIILQKIESGEFILDNLKLKKEFNLDTMACNSCCQNKVFPELAFLFRAEIPASDLVKYQNNSQQRMSCWYGRFCRTQEHNFAHRDKYNHVCHPTSAQVQRF